MYLILGAGGQVGGAFVDILGNQCIGYTHKGLDVVRFGEYIPDLLTRDISCVINCSAYTAVDRAEEHKPSAFAVNGGCIKDMISFCKALDIPFVYISTDYVFDGKKREPYLEADYVAPLNTYGKSKLMGERVAAAYIKSYIVRTSWVFGHGNNIIEKAVDITQKFEGTLKFVTDQYGRPTYAYDLAFGILKLLESGQYGTYHIAGEGVTNWYHFCKLALVLAGVKNNVAPITTAGYNEMNKNVTLAERPLYSVLDTNKAGALGIHLRNHASALEEYIKRRSTKKEGKLS